MRPALDLRRFRPVVFLMAATLRVSTLASCAPVVTAINSSVDLGGTAPVERMLVFANIRSEGFSDAMYDGFEAGMTSGLERCGVRSKAVNLDFRGLEDARKFSVWTELQPNAILVIGRAGGHATFGTDESYSQALHGNRPAELSGTGWTSSRLNYEFKLLDLKSGKVTWVAKVVLDIGGSDDASGNGFAINIISRLQTDGVLKGCPQEVAPPPVIPHGSYPGG
jgi:hypothetical protein